jgi:microcystin degradation protein MlrC
MRIAVGGILHETSTFAPGRTRLSDFQGGRGLHRGEGILARFRGGNVCIGGFLQGADELGFEAVPLLWTFAFPGPLIERAAYETLKGEFLDRLRQADAEDPLDGVLLDLHGAMVIEGIDDGDGDMAEAVREVVGRRPIVVTTDLHGNHTRRRVAAADAIIGYDTYPHVDMAERGVEAARLIVRSIRGEVRPAAAIRQLPLLWNADRQITAHPPMDACIARLHEMERRPGMLTMTVATGFPWADVPEMGASVIAVADGDAALAQAAADELGDWILERRRDWRSEPRSVRAALAAGEKLGKHPIILADHADNTGGGAGGDSTEMLRTFLELKLRDAVVLYMVDVDVAQQAHAAGVARRIHVRLGGKSHPQQGPPIELDAEVVAVTDGAFRYDGPMYAGLDGHMGKSAWLRRGGVSVVVVSEREQPFDPAFARSLGIDCAAMKYIGVKSAVHFRSGFEKIAGAIFNVDCQAIHAHDFASLEYKKRRKMFPLEID